MICEHVHVNIYWLTQFTVFKAFLKYLRMVGNFGICMVNWPHSMHKMIIFGLSLSLLSVITTTLFSNSRKYRLQIQDCLHAKSGKCRCIWRYYLIYSLSLMTPAFFIVHIFIPYNNFLSVSYIFIWAFVYCRNTNRQGKHKTTSPHFSVKHPQVYLTIQSQYLNN